MQNQLAIKDIVQLSSVSKSTVSRVLNNESGVSPHSRQRVGVKSVQFFSCAPGSRHAQAER